MFAPGQGGRNGNGLLRPLVVTRVDLGTELALCPSMKEKVRDPEQLRSWQAAHRFKLEVYRLIDDSSRASRDFRYRDQVRDAASAIESDIGEGFRRYFPGVICQFLTYA